MATVSGGLKGEPGVEDVGGIVGAVVVHQMEITENVEVYAYARVVTCVVA